MQTLSGLVLDIKRKGSPEVHAPDTLSNRKSMAIQHLLNTFLCLNVVHFVVLMTLAHLECRKNAVVMSASSGHGSLNISHDLDKDQPSSAKSPENTLLEGFSVVHQTIRLLSTPSYEHYKASFLRRRTARSEFEFG